MGIETKFTVKFTNAPQWLDCLEITRDGDVVRIEAIRSSGTLLGDVLVGAAEFSRMSSILLDDVQP